MRYRSVVSVVTIKHEYENPVLEVEPMHRSAWPIWPPEVTKTS